MTEATNIRAFATLPASLAPAVSRLHDRWDWLPVEQSLAWTHVPGGRTAMWVITTVDGEVRATSRLELWFSRRGGQYLARADRGPVAPTLTALASHLRGLRALLQPTVGMLAVRPWLLPEERPEAHVALAGSGFRLNPEPPNYSTTLVLDIARPLPEILHDLKPETRRHLQRAARAKVAYGIVTSGGALESLVSAHNSFARSRGLSSLSPRLAHELASRRTNSGLPSLLPIGITVDSRAVGGAFFILNGNRMVYQWGFTDRDQAPGLPLMHGCFWFAIQHVHGRGIDTFDLGGYWPDRQADDPINRFKRGFSTTIEDLGHEYTIDMQQRRRWMAVFKPAWMHRRTLSRLSH